VLSGFNFTSYECMEEIFLTGKTSALNCEKDYPTYASNILMELYENEQ
jgi:hypothetical protein